MRHIRSNVTPNFLFYRNEVKALGVHLAKEPPIQQTIRYSYNWHNDQCVKDIEEIELFGMRVVVHVNRADTCKEEKSNTVRLQALHDDVPGELRLEQHEEPCYTSHIMKL